ncbi:MULTISPECIES: diguanylate cyclase domain-containing protein [Halomonas]|uniref:sensor domain-containing diguanylate cyclase n=1 Tax=Halomonas TaxID=2745 RepID=UPI0027E09E9A|nr:MULTISPECIES: diguanylate cyclase [Halomonas]
MAKLFSVVATLSLQVRMLIGLAATWLVVITILLVWGWYTGKDLVREVNFSHLRYETRLIADEVTEEIDTRLDMLGRLAALRNNRALLDASSEALRDSGALLELFDALVVMDATGKVAADWPPTPGRQGLDISDREYFSFMREVRRPYVSEPIYGRVIGLPLVLLMVPLVSDDGRFEGALAGVVEVNAGGIFRRLSRVRIGNDGYAAVFSAAGQVLYHPDQRQVMGELGREGDLNHNPALDLALYGWQGERYGPAFSGEMTFQSYRQVWPANWVVGVFLPENQVLAPLRGLLERLGAVGIGIALLLLPLLGWMVWLLLRPLYQLQSQIAQVGKGTRGRVVLDTQMKELVQLASAFNAVEVEREKALADLRGREAFLDGVLASSPIGMFVTDTQGRITYVNDALVQLTGRSPDDMDRSAWVQAIHAEDRESAIELWRYSLMSGQTFLRQYRYWREDGELLWLEVHASQVAIDDDIFGFVGTVKDITARRQQEAMSQWEAEHDPLTGLLNRRGFERRLEEAMVDWRKTSTPSALILFDLDRFKPINDEGGHPLGDEMLKRIAREVSGCVRSSDHVARQGGDEFAVLLPSCSLAQARRIGEAILSAIHGTCVVHEGHEYRVTSSLGITEFRPGDVDVAALVERADAASYTAKREGRNRLVVDASSA